jgi:hypothetical protein
VGILEERRNGIEQQGKRDKAERKKGEETYCPYPSTPPDTPARSLF